MREIAVPGIAIQIPIVGFGCSALAGTGKKNAPRLLGTAFDAGVRHFDIARYYGYGEAEGMLGAFVKPRRSEVTITTKFGIEPPRRTIALRIAMQAGRRLVRLVPATRKFMQRRAQGLVKGGGFSVKNAQTSLETSLRQLGTDYIDFYLLHDYEVPEHPPDEMVAFLTDAVKAGKIRYFGLGTRIDDVLLALGRQPELCRIIQFENSALRRNVERLPRAGRARLVITHGAVSTSYRLVLAFLKTHGEVVRNWSRILSIDCSNKDTISALMLSYAAQVNPNGLLLFSSKSALRVNKNVKAVLEPRVSPAQVALFGQLVERDLMPSIQVERTGVDETSVPKDQRMRHVTCTCASDTEE